VAGESASSTPGIAYISFSSVLLCVSLSEIDGLNGRHPTALIYLFT